MMKRLIRSMVERFPTVAMFYRNMRDWLDQRQPARMTPWGFSLAGHDIMASGDFEPEETAIVRKLLADVDLLVNVGANVGYYCCHALIMGKQVIAVEPNVRNLHYLLRNIKSNGWESQAEVFPVAMGNGTDILQMCGGTGSSLIKGWAGIPESYVTLVPVLSLDRLLGDTLHGKRALILVDIEGAEWMMLQGAQKTLKNDPRPVWMMEISLTEHQPEGITINTHFAETFGLFFEYGYRAFTADAKSEEITPQIVREVISGSKKLVTHNFVFRIL